MSDAFADIIELEYEIIDNESVTITKYSGHGENIVIPDHSIFGRKPVTKIGDEAFLNVVLRSRSLCRPVPSAPGNSHFLIAAS